MLVAGMTTPSAPSKDASRHFLDAQPPLPFQEGTKVFRVHDSFRTRKLSRQIPDSFQNGTTLLQKSLKFPSRPADVPMRVNYLGLFPGARQVGRPIAEDCPP
jgi:hypothetical protein